MGNFGMLKYNPVGIECSISSPLDSIILFKFDDFTQNALRSVSIKAKWSSHVFYVTFSKLYHWENGHGALCNLHILNSVVVIDECMSLHIGIAGKTQYLVLIRVDIENAVGL